MNILEKVYICSKYYSHKANNNDAELCLDLDKLKGTTALGSCWLYYSINDSKKELTDIKNQLALYNGFITDVAKMLQKSFRGRNHNSAKPHKHRLCGLFCLFPLNGAGWFGGNIVNHSVNALHFINYAGRNAPQQIVRQAGPVGSHCVHAVYHA